MSENPKRYHLDRLTSIDEITSRMPRGTDILVNTVTISDWPDSPMARLNASVPDGRYAAVLFLAGSVWVWREVALPQSIMKT